MLAATARDDGNPPGPRHAPRAPAEPPCGREEIAGAYSIRASDVWAIRSWLKPPGRSRGGSTRRRRIRVRVRILEGSQLRPQRSSRRPTVGEGENMVLTFDVQR